MFDISEIKINRISEIERLIASFMESKCVLYSANDSFHIIVDDERTLLAIKDNVVYVNITLALRQYSNFKEKFEEYFDKIGISVSIKTDMNVYTRAMSYMKHFNYSYNFITDGSIIDLVLNCYGGFNAN